MSDPATEHDRQVERLSKAEEPTGRQDLIAPSPTTEQSDPAPVDVQRGMRLWLGFTIVGVLFVVVIIVFWAMR